MHVRTPAADILRLHELCRRRGLALTVQRRAILEELHRRMDHPTADDVYAATVARLPGLSRTTVYRVLEALVAAGVVRRVAHAGAAIRYDPRVERHHHLTCERCGALIDLADEALPRLPLRELALPGFRVSDYTIQFHGICTPCHSRAPRAPGKKSKPWPPTSRAARRTRT